MFTSSDSTVLTLTDQADGTTIALRATKSSGSVTVTATATNADGTTAVGTLSITFSAQVPPVVDVSNVEIVPGIPS